MASTAARHSRAPSAVRIDRASRALARLPRFLLRLEGVVLFAAAIAVYIDADYSVLALALFFFVPDISFAAYAGGPRVGAPVYNSLHTLLWPILIVGGGVVGEDAVLIQIGLIWLAHIGMDRGLGFGLKYPTAFEDTHLHRV